jgi:cbb3-type cytochrome oxidase maturation protein
MEILYLLVPLSVVIVFLIAIAFWWSLRSGQFDDLEGPGYRILMDDDKARQNAATAARQEPATAARQEPATAAQQEPAPAAAQAHGMDGPDGAESPGGGEKRPAGE